jgi:hypothetical protein
MHFRPRARALRNTFETRIPDSQIIPVANLAPNALFCERRFSVYKYSKLLAAAAGEIGRVEKSGLFWCKA